jgi:hypothetical protein
MLCMKLHYSLKSWRSWWCFPEIIHLLKSSKLVIKKLSFGGMVFLSPFYELILSIVHYMDKVIYFKIVYSLIFTICGDVKCDVLMLSLFPCMQFHYWFWNKLQTLLPRGHFSINSKIISSFNPMRKVSRNEINPHTHSSISLSFLSCVCK